MNNPIDGTDGKLGHGFTSADELEKMDIGPRDRPRPTYMNAKLDPEYKQELIDLLKEFEDCFAWEYLRCLFQIEQLFDPWSEEF